MNKAKILAPRRGKKSTMSVSPGKDIVLAEGELFIENDETAGVMRIKIGDGSTVYSSLPYRFSETGKDVKFNPGSSSLVSTNVEDAIIEVSANASTYAVVTTAANGLAPKITNTSKYLKGDGTWSTPTNTTYAIMTSGTSGLVPSGGTSAKFLRGDAQWEVPVDTTYDVATTANAGLLPTLAGGTTNYLRADGTWQTPPNTTYGTVTTAAAGLAPKVTNTANFLKGDGTWAVPTNTTYGTVTSSANGLAPKITNNNGYLKGDGTWTVPADTTYDVATTATNGLMPALGGGTAEYLRADGTWVTPPDTTYANVSTASAGLAPKVTDTSKFLKGDGTWAAPSNTTYAAMSSAELVTGTATNSRAMRADYAKAGINSLIDTKIQELDVTGQSGISAIKTISAWSEADGKVSISTQDISTVSTVSAGLAPKVTDTGKYLKGDGTWETPPNTTYGTVSTASAGLAPKVTNTSNFLKGDGTWAVPTNTTYAVATTTTNGLMSAADKIKVNDLGSAAFKDITNTYSSTGTDPVTGKAVAEAIAQQPSPMKYRGTLGPGGTITTLPVDGSALEGDTYKVIADGTYAGQSAKSGDMFICETQTASANTWNHIPSGDEPGGTVTSITIKATSPISIDSSAAITTNGTRTLSHANSGATSGSYGDSSAQTPTYGGTFKVPYLTINATGHVTSISDHTVTIPASDNTDVAVTQTATTTNANYEVLFSESANNTTTTEGARKNSNLKFNPSTGNLQATQLNGVTIGNAPKFTDTTYAVMTSGTSGLVPASGTSTKYLRGDGQWQIPDNTTYDVATTAVAGLLPTLAGGTANYLRADGTWVTPPNTTYGTVTTAANGLAPKVTDTSKFLKGDGTWAVPTNTTYGTVSTTANGLAPKITNNNGYLKGDGTWTVPTDTTYAPMTSGSSGLVPSGGTSATYLKGDGSWGTPPNTTYGTVTTAANGLAPKVTNTANFLKGDGTWAVPTNTTYANVSTAAAGLAPKVTNTANFLKGDGTWSVPTNTTYAVATTTTNGLMSAADKIILDNVPNTYLPLAGGELTGRLTTRDPINDYIVGTGTAAQDKGSGVSPRYFPAKWTFDTGNSPVDGDIIFVKIPVGGSDMGTYISIDNGVTYNPISIAASTRLTTQYAVGNIVGLIYDAAGQTASVYNVNGGDSRITVTGSWRLLNYYDSGNDTGQYIRRVYHHFVAGANKVFPYTLIMQTADDRWESIITSSTTAATKTRNQHGFRLGQLLLMYANATYNENADIGNNNVWDSYTGYSVIDHRYSFNTANNATSGTTVRKPIYLVGSIGNDGLFYLDETWWTQTLPTTEDGKLYILVGVAHNYYQMDFPLKHPIYHYVNGALREYTQDAGSVNGYTVAKDVPSSAVFTDTTYAVMTSGGSGLVPTGGTSATYLKGNGTWGTPTDTTYANVSTAAAGLAPKVTNTSNFLKGDGTWAVPTNTTYANVSTAAAGLAPKVTNTSNFLKGDGTWSVPTNTTYAPMTSGGSGLTPTGGTSATYLKGDGTWDTPTNTTYGTVSTTTSGLAPKITDTSKFLKGDGTWAKPTDTTYAVMTSGSSGLVPSGGTSATYLKGDGSWGTPAGSTYDVVNTTTNGLVPAIHSVSGNYEGNIIYTSNQSATLNDFAWVGTSAQYDALTDKSLHPTTLYFIRPDSI